ncbi:MAG: integrase arm-type DNA-binding domain-containing protein [Desulfovibrio sp.]|jgi:integrase|nr:integrase arm-type DNA-binding domain-containing protein [Desulfovibrio sp.]
MPLTDKALKAMRPGERYKGKWCAYDGHGLHIDCKPKGALTWRYSFSSVGSGGKGTVRVITLGNYPEMSLMEARAAHAEAKGRIARGEEPDLRKAAKLPGRTFGEVADLWLEKACAALSDGTLRCIRIHLDRLDPIRGKDIAAVTRHDILGCVEAPVEDRGVSRPLTAYTAKQVVTVARRVFDFAIARELVGVNPAAGAVAGMESHKGGNFAAQTTPDGVGRVLRAIDAVEGNPVVKAFLRLLPLTLCRPGELVVARWDEFDLDGDGPVWRIPAERTKLRRDHIVPLCRQAVAVLAELRPLTVVSGYLFPAQGRSGKADTMTIDAPRKLLRIAGIGPDVQTLHGFRATGSTLLHESGWSSDIVVAALAHQVGGIKGRYMRSTYLAERTEMAQWWGDCLDALREGRTVAKVSRTRTVAGVAS